MSLFNEDSERWLELLFSLPPIELEECARKQQEGKKDCWPSETKTT